MKILKKKNKQSVKIPISELTFEGSVFAKDGHHWRTTTLYDFAKAKGYPTIEIPLCAMNINYLPFDCKDLYDFVFECNRVIKCTDDHPILIDNRGCIADGYHRVCKALLDGKETIKAIRLLKMPAPDYDD